jgi:hypothetical protein
MRKIILLFSLAASFSALGQKPFSITGIVPENVPPAALDVNYTGTYPTDPSPYLSNDAWRVWVIKPGESKPTEVKVEGVVKLSGSTGFDLQKFRLSLSGAVPVDTQVTVSQWHASFNPSVDSGLMGQAFDSTIVRTDAAAVTPAPAGSTTAVKPSCDNKAPAKMPFLCPVSSGGTPDLSFTGNFTAAGGSKPLYQFEVLGGLYLDREIKQVWNFRPGFTTKIEINQNPPSPNTRTRFDPDSITAGLAFQRIKPLTNPWLHIYGLQFDEMLPGGEFTRTDPSSNIIASSSVLFALIPFSAKGHPTYGTLYPVMAIEAGKNLNKPSELDGVSVDLSHYNAIFRGVLGADGKVARASQDRTVDVVSLSASYRVRLPAFDEPFIETVHQVTTASLTTKARHWIEADASVSPWSFKYLAITAKYQYGVLPPSFSLVDHSFSLGLTLTAIQSKKPQTGTSPFQAPSGGTP